MMTHSQRIASDIRAIERHLRALRDMAAEITNPVIVIMGPSRIGIDALDSFGAWEKLLDAIAAYEAAHAHLCAEHAKAEIDELVAQWRAAHGEERAEVRRYAMGQIAAWKDAA